jgi:imidazolonepropionase-like amidohydrolase
VRSTASNSYPAAAPLPESCAVVEFPHATVLPGLIDTHVPLGGDGRDGADVGRTHRAGVKIVTGTDGGISTAKPHGIVSTGISMLVASGISAADALASATSIAAQVCGPAAARVASARVMTPTCSSLMAIR